MPRNCKNKIIAQMSHQRTLDIPHPLMSIKKKIKTPRITDEGWNSQKRLSDPVEKKLKERKRRKKRLLYLHPKLSSGLVPYMPFYRIGIACRKMIY